MCNKWVQKWHTLIPSECVTSLLTCYTLLSYIAEGVTSEYKSDTLWLLHVECVSSLLTCYTLIHLPPKCVTSEYKTDTLWILCVVESHNVSLLYSLVTVSFSSLFGPRRCEKLNPTSEYKSDTLWHFHVTFMLTPVKVCHFLTHLLDLVFYATEVCNKWVQKRHTLISVSLPYSLVTHCRCTLPECVTSEYRSDTLWFRQSVSLPYSLVTHCCRRSQDV